MGGGVFHRWQYLDEFEDVQNPPELGRTVLGLSEKAFWQRLARAQSDLVKARTAALERDRPAPAYRELRIVGRSWGWLELQVYPPGEPELYGIVGVGVAAPGSRPTGELADSHHRRGWSEVITGSLGGAVVGYVAPAAFWQAAPVLAGGSAVVVAAAGGAGGHLVARRGRRLQNSSRLLTGDDAVSPWLLALAVQLGQISAGIENYEQQMADDSRRHGLDPIPLRLTASPQQIEDELHRSMWDVAIGQSLDEPVDVLAEAAAVADSVDAAIGAAWSIRGRARVHDTPPSDSPDGPAVFRPTVSNLRLLRQSLDDDTQTAAATGDELGRLNAYDQ